MSKSKLFLEKAKKVGAMAGAGAGAGWGIGYAVGGNHTKVPMLVKGKVKTNNKKAPTIQRATAIGGLATGIGLGLLKKKAKI